MIDKNALDRTVSAKFDAYVDRVVREVRSFPQESRQSGDDSGLDDVWEEFKFQVQQGESFSWDLYEEAIRIVCRGVVESLPPHEIDLLWPYTGADENWDDENDGPPNHNVKVEGVADELYDRTYSWADDEKLESAASEDVAHEAAEEVLPQRVRPRDRRAHLPLTDRERFPVSSLG